jgi:hypothetical protein
VPVNPMTAGRPMMDHATAATRRPARQPPSTIAETGLPEQ